jgi:hypothetical protein
MKENLVSRLTGISDVKSQHVAAIIKGNKIVALEVNKDRSCISKNLTCTIHAEASVIIKLLMINACVKDLKMTPSGKWQFYGHEKMRNKFKKFSIIVVRYSKNNLMVNSKPCEECIDLMKQVNIKTVYYSNCDSIIIKEHVSAVESYKSVGTQVMLHIQYPKQYEHPASRKKRLQMEMKMKMKLTMKV